MRRAVAFILVLYVMGCGSSQTKYVRTPKPVDYKSTLVHREVVIMDRDVWTTPSFKSRLTVAIDRFPQALPQLSAVYLKSRIDHPQIKGEALAYYDYQQQLIVLAVFNGFSETKVLRTFYHELGHAIEAGLDQPELDRWDTLYRRRLAVADYFAPLEDKWSEALSWRGFPSAYCLHSQSEYFAEHIQEVATDFLGHMRDYPQEHTLLREMGLLPEEGPLSLGSSVERKDASPTPLFFGHADGRMLRRPAPWQRWGRRVLWRRSDQRTAA